MNHAMVRGNKSKLMNLNKEEFMQYAERLINPCRLHEQVIVGKNHLHWVLRNKVNETDSEIESMRVVVNYISDKRIQSLSDMCERRVSERLPYSIL